MLTNYKFAKDLQPGDVFYIGSVPLMYIQRLGADLGEDGVSCIRPGEKSAQKRYLRADESYQVEPRAAVLTPAQQHAEELFHLACRVRAAGQNAPAGTLGGDAQLLIDKIDPPQPVSVKTVLSLLRSARGAQVVTGGLADAIDDTLKRAHRAGQI